MQYDFGSFGKLSCKLGKAGAQKADPGDKK